MYNTTTKMVEARQFFIHLGMPIDNKGLIKPHLTLEQLSALTDYERSTAKAGIQMPTEVDFHRKTLLAVSLWRQRESDKIQYLLGKGIGVEIALRGNVKGRKKRTITFPYRSHSDFELYGVDGEPYTKEFRQVLGAQEYFPSTKTKGLLNLPAELLHTTAESCDLGGIEILIPQLELLFLDKFTARESTPRTEGNDAELLARQYVLNSDKIHEYLDSFVIEPAIPLIIENNAGDLDSYTLSVKMTYNRLNGGYLTHEQIVTRINSEQQSTLAKYRNRNRSIDDATDPSLRSWENLHPSDIDTTGTIREAYVERLVIRLRTSVDKKIESLQERHNQIEKILQAV